MNGEINVDSEPGVGSRFEIIIPLKTNASSAIHKAIQQTDKSESKKPIGKVLIVEDFKPNIVVAGSILHSLGYKYDVAETGQQAINMHIENNYKVILMDIQMPIMDGYEATRAIREYEKNMNITPALIIGLTAYASTTSRKKCIEAGMDGYIAKPFKSQDLVNAIG